MARVIHRVTTNLADSLSNSVLANKPGAGVAGREMRCVAMAVQCAAATTLKIEDTAGTAMTGTYSFGANGGIVYPYNPDGWWQTAEGEGVRVDTGAAAVDVFQLTLLEV